MGQGSWGRLLTSPSSHCLVLAVPAPILLLSITSHTGTSGLYRELAWGEKPRTNKPQACLLETFMLQGGRQYDSTQNRPGGGQTGEGAEESQGQCDTHAGSAQPPAPLDSFQLAASALPPVMLSPKRPPSVLASCCCDKMPEEKQPSRERVCLNPQIRCIIYR